MQAIQAATLPGPDEEVAKLEAGMVVDIVATDVSPPDDIMALQGIAFQRRNGVRHPQY